MRHFATGFVILLSGLMITSKAFSADGYDKTLVDRAYHAADDGAQAAEQMHKDNGHNFGGHAIKAAEAFQKAHKELEEAEKYAREHNEKKSK